MSGDNAMLEPVRHIKIADKEYRLDGRFSTLKAIQQELNEDIFLVQARVPKHMRVDEVALLLMVAINASGGSVKQDEIGTLIVDEVGIDTADYTLLRAELMTWLAISMTSKRERSKKAMELDEVLVKMRDRLASPGQSTSSSV